MVRKLPKSFTATPDEDEFFAKEKAAGAEPAEEPAEELTEAPEEAPEAAADDETVVEETPEAVVDDEAVSDDETPSKTVPIGALHEERERRKELQAKIGQMEATFEKLMARINQPAAAPQPQVSQAPQPEIPAYDADPLAHLKARLDMLAQVTGGQQQHLQQQMQMQQFVEALGGLENQIRATTPDYDQAINYAKTQRDAELQALGYSDPAQRLNLIRQEILSTAAYNMQRGLNPIEQFYNYAKVRGWAATPSKPAAAAKLATVAKAVAASKSLPRGGTAPAVAVSLADLATMEDAEFDKHFDKVMRKNQA